jgi:diguanylate cyclase (GGDEF)-like protein
MELLLWRWSVADQWTSLVLITLFFALLTRTFRLDELRSWVAAWASDLLALGVTLFFWSQGGSRYLTPSSVLYLGFKVAFAVLLIRGALQLQRPGAARVTNRIVLLAAGTFALGGFLIPNLETLGITASSALAALFLYGGSRLLQAPREMGTTWLGVAMLVRGTAGVVEAGAYGVGAAGTPGPLLDAARSFQSAHSFVDASTEWLLALASVLALSDRLSRELRRSNQDLLSAQEDLRRLADRDALTALANRRALPEIFRGVQPRGALLLFFDLDGFKEINDRFGHPVGDECLRRFAAHLRDAFRPQDAVVRNGGDEFLVVASGLDRPGADERIGRLRESLSRTTGAAPAIAFSVGFADLNPGGQPEEALLAADQAMYTAKKARAAARGRAARTA